MRASIATKTVSAWIFRPGKGALLLLACCALLMGCASGTKSVQDLETLALTLTACLPEPPEGWQVEAMEINEKITDLGKGKIDAALEYREIDGEAEMEIDVRTSRWCCMMVIFSGDLQKLTVQGRKAALDARKNKSVLYVTLTHEIVVIFEADNIKTAEQLVQDFASMTDFDCLEKQIKQK
jgi:hypothetical protein